MSLISSTLASSGFILELAETVFVQLEQVSGVFLQKPLYSFPLLVACHLNPISRRKNE